jgi:hypothetical protein
MFVDQLFREDTDFVSALDCLAFHVHFPQSVFVFEQPRIAGFMEIAAYRNALNISVDSHVIRIGRKQIRATKDETGYNKRQYQKNY